MAAVRTEHAFAPFAPTAESTNLDPSRHHLFGRRGINKPRANCGDSLSLSRGVSTHDRARPGLRPREQKLHPKKKTNLCAANLLGTEIEEAAVALLSDAA